MFISYKYHFASQTFAEGYFYFIHYPINKKNDATAKTQRYDSYRCISTAA